MANPTIRRIYEPAGPDEGARVLVDRLWPRGIRREDAALTLWLKDVAPSTELRRWFGHDPARWVEFSRRYRSELDRPCPDAERLAALVRTRRVTLLYGARDPVHNHAVVLAAWLRERTAGPEGKVTS